LAPLDGLGDASTEGEVPGVARGVFGLGDGLLFLPLPVGEGLGLATTVYVMEVELVWPSWLKALTVYVKVPVSDVLSNPGLVEPLLSLQVAIPGPSVPSKHLKLMVTFLPTR
jgi:hypothetical protein